METPFEGQPAYSLFHVAAGREQMAHLARNAPSLTSSSIASALLLIRSISLSGESIHSLSILFPIAVRHLLRTEKSEMSYGSISSGCLRCSCRGSCTLREEAYQLSDVKRSRTVSSRYLSAAAAAPQAGSLSSSPIEFRVAMPHFLHSHSEEVLISNSPRSLSTTLIFADSG